MAAEIAAYHHEQWQGNGYPFGKLQDEIPLAARIVTISDIYDALRSKRTYKPVMSHNEAIAIMRAESSARFDPDIFSAFEHSLADFQDIHYQYGG
jgi:HD-GYP domain-containing protein (c-di-GMP phosphodiesterase class II)